MSRAILMAAIFAALSCGAQNHEIRPSDSDRACVRDSDCVAVYEGPLSCCGTGECANAAINAANLARYMQVLDQRTPTCDPAPSCPRISCSASSFVRCTDGLCVYPSDLNDAAVRD
jgi:hypothetical protein